MAFNDIFQCKVCGKRWEYSILCYVFVEKGEQPQHKEDEICEECEQWVLNYNSKCLI